PDLLDDAVAGPNLRLVEPTAEAAPVELFIERAAVGHLVRAGVTDENVSTSHISSRSDLSHASAASAARRRACRRRPPSPGRDRRSGCRPGSPAGLHRTAAPGSA